MKIIQNLISDLYLVPIPYSGSLKNCNNPCLNWHWHAAIHIEHIILVEDQCQASVNFEKPKNTDKIK